jgi:hypothetical protein
MANAVYTKAKQSLLNGEINTSSSNYKILLLDKNFYTVNFSTDQYVSDIPPSAIKGISNNLSNVTNTNGIFDADDIPIDHDGSIFNAMVIYQVGSSNSNSRLIMYIDDSDGLPFEGSNSSIPITIFWSNTVNKILSL